MKKLIASISLFLIIGCASVGTEKMQTAIPADCPGNTELPDGLKDQFVTDEDDALLNLALGAPGKGGLCSGKVYKAKENSEIFIYRAWNSTNPNSKMGKWWAFGKPSGRVSTYRSDYEICYQWSPLDKLVYGRLKPGTRIVVGPGQSAICSEYLTYPASEKKQIFIKDATGSIEAPEFFDLVFKWE